jgi:hypothetical protein
VIRRPRRGIAATLTALIVLVVCALVATISIQLLTGRPPVVSYTAIAADLHRTQWRDLTVAIVAGGAALVGLVLLLAALIPGKAMVLPLGADDSGLVAGVSRRSLRATLQRAAGSVDGIASTKLRLRGNTISVTAHADRTDDTGLADALREAINARVHQLAPAVAPVVRIRVHPARGDQA